MKFNRSQILGLDIDRHIVLDAGAGTGKTTVMAERYVRTPTIQDTKVHISTPKCYNGY